MWGKMHLVSLVLANGARSLTYILHDYGWSPFLGEDPRRPELRGALPIEQISGLDQWDLRIEPSKTRHFSGISWDFIVIHRDWTNKNMGISEWDKNPPANYNICVIIENQWFTVTLSKMVIFHVATNRLPEGIPCQPPEVPGIGREVSSSESHGPTDLGRWSKAGSWWIC
jgi:hypothetical protein